MVKKKDEGKGESEEAKYKADSSKELALHAVISPISCKHQMSSSYKCTSSALPFEAPQIMTLYIYISMGLTVECRISNMTP